MTAVTLPLPGFGFVTPVLRLKMVREGTCDLPAAITTPADAAAMFLDRLSDEAQECLEVLVVNVKNRPLGVHQVYRGNASATMVKVGEVVRIPLLAGGTGFILVHNHPSGDPSPSPDDIAITRQVAEAAKLLDLELLDHLIIGHGTWVSMRERMLLT